jgi:hypothetical protein
MSAAIVQLVGVGIHGKAQLTLRTGKSPRHPLVLGNQSPHEIHVSSALRATRRRLFAKHWRLIGRSVRLIIDMGQQWALRLLGNGLFNADA